MCFRHEDWKFNKNIWAIFRRTNSFKNILKFFSSKNAFYILRTIFFRDMRTIESEINLLNVKMAEDCKSLFAVHQKAATTACRRHRFKMIRNTANLPTLCVTWILAKIKVYVSIRPQNLEANGCGKIFTDFLKVFLFPITYPAHLKRSVL